MLADYWFKKVWDFYWEISLLRYTDIPSFFLAFLSYLGLILIDLIRISIVIVKWGFLVLVHYSHIPTIQDRLPSYEFCLFLSSLGLSDSSGASVNMPTHNIPHLPNVTSDFLLWFVGFSDERGILVLLQKKWSEY